MAIETFNIDHKLAPVCLHDLLNVKSSEYCYIIIWFH